LEPAPPNVGGIGGTLRAARERRGIPLRRIADATKVSIGVLECLERNDISRLPGGIFSRAIVRSYANEVGLDPEQTIQDFIAQFPVDAVTAGHPTSRPVEDPEAVESSQETASVFGRLAALSVPIVILMLYFGNRNYSRVSEVDDHAASGGAETAHAVGQLAGRPGAQRPDASPPGPQVDSPASQGSEIKAEAETQDEVGKALKAAKALEATKALEDAKAKEAKAEEAKAREAKARQEEKATLEARAKEAAPAANIPEPAAQAQPASQDLPERLLVGLVADATSWVTIAVDGQPAFAREFQAGERQVLEVGRELVLTATDGAALRVTLNGQDAQPLGPAGQQVTVRMNLTNFRNYLIAP
jgi:cytoskeletal protein RodZ